MSAARHPLPEALELYVLGALDRSTALRLEGHVRRCPPCASALAEEARLETTLRALVPAVRSPAKVVRLPAPAAQSRRPGPALSGTLAAAAAIMLAVWGLEGGPAAPAGRGLGVVAASVAGEAPLVCEAEGEAPLCPWPGALASLPLPAATEDNLCRVPAGGACGLQSRLR